MEKERPCEASRAPSCRRIVIWEDDIAKRGVKASIWGWVRNVVLIKCIFGSGKPRGGQDFGVGATRVEQRDKGSVHEQPGDKVDGSYHSKEGSK
jgi:hypothetical protein